MKRVFIVIGKSGSRKSSTIRALTGIGNKRRVLQIRTSDKKTINVFVCHTSLQEVKMTPEYFVEEVENHEDNPESVLVALRNNASQNRKYPNAEEYISYFIKAGWQIAGVASLHGGPTEFSIGNISQLIPIQNSTQIPTNEIAHIIKGQWQWQWL